MPALAFHASTRVRAIEQTDLHDIKNMIENAWQIYLRCSPAELWDSLRTGAGFLAEDKVGLRGFMMIEPQYPDMALIIAAGLRDTWSVKPYLDLLLPEIEQAALTQNLSALIHIGNGHWLTRELWRYDFRIREWIIAFERWGSDLPPAMPGPAWVRGVQQTDLEAIIELDRLAFDHVWRKSFRGFNEALAKAAAFMIAEMQGQIVGYGWSEIHQGHAHLTRLAVHPAYQGQGIGGQLLHMIMTDLLVRGATLITLNTQEDNYRSRTLYERFGFVYARQRMPVLWKDLTG